MAPALRAPRPGGGSPHAVLDEEITCVQPDGRSDFRALQRVVAPTLLARVLKKIFVDLIGQASARQPAEEELESR